MTSIKEDNIPPPHVCPNNNNKVKQKSNRCTAQHREQRHLEIHKGKYMYNMHMGKNNYKYHNSCAMANVKQRRRRRRAHKTI